jgi:hypothetical protein
MAISRVRPMLAISDRKRVPTPMGPAEICSDDHMRVVARLVPFIGDEVEHLLHRSFDDDLAFDEDRAFLLSGPI